MDPEAGGVAERESRARVWWRALRPSQWLKNLAVFVPLLFAHRADEPFAWARAGLCALGFCLAASAGYLVNDALDRERDRRHPRKRLRPIAAGLLSPARALLVAAALAAVGLGAARLSGVTPAAWVALYLGSTLLYSALLKRVFLLDVLALAGLLVLRVEAGAAAVAVEASVWLLACTALLALALGFGKRLAELDRLLGALPLDEDARGATSFAVRPALAAYRQRVLRALVAGATLALAGAYSWYTVAERTRQSVADGAELAWTIPFAALAGARYLGLVLFASERVEDPAALLLADRWLAAAVLCWAALCALLLYS